MINGFVSQYEGRIRLSLNGPPLWPVSDRATRTDRRSPLCSTVRLCQYEAVELSIQVWLLWTSFILGPLKVFNSPVETYGRERGSVGDRPQLRGKVTTGRVIVLKNHSLD